MGGLIAWYVLAGGGVFVAEVGVLGGIGDVGA